MDIKTAICDDEHNQAEYNKMLINKWADENNISAAVDMFESAENFKSARREGKNYDYDEYMGIFSVVFQDFKLFAFPLGQNVAASVDVDSDRAKQCLNMAGFGERLADTPNGLNTSLYKDFEEDGVEISGGEAQKIAIARALYKDAPFIVLDEPTAALDPIAEFEISGK